MGFVGGFYGMIMLKVTGLGFKAATTPVGFFVVCVSCPAILTLQSYKREIKEKESQFDPVLSSYKVIEL
jgi:hypothetical protein